MGYWLDNKPTGDIEFTRREYSYSLDAAKEISRVNTEYNALRDNPEAASLPIDDARVIKFLSNKYEQSFDSQTSYNQIKEIGASGSKVYNTAYEMALNEDETVETPDKKAINKYLIEALHIDEIVDNITDEMEHDDAVNFLSEINDRINDELGMPMDELAKESCLEKYADLIEEYDISIADYEDYKADLEFANEIDDPAEREEYETSLKDMYFGDYDNPDSIIKAMQRYDEAGYFDDPEHADVEYIRMQFIDNTMVANDSPEDYDYNLGYEEDYEMSAEELSDLEDEEERKKHTMFGVPTLTPGEHVVMLSADGTASIIDDPYKQNSDSEETYDWYDKLYEQAADTPTPDDVVDGLWPDGEDHPPVSDHIDGVDTSGYMSAAAEYEIDTQADYERSASEQTNASNVYNTDASKVNGLDTASSNSISNSDVSSNVSTNDYMENSSGSFDSANSDSTANEAAVDDAGMEIGSHPSASSPVAIPESELLRAQPLSVGLDEPFRMTDVFPDHIDDQPEFGASNNVIYYSDETLQEFNKVMHPATQNFIQKNMEMAAEQAEQASQNTIEQAAPSAPEMTGAERQAKYLAMIDAVYKPEPTIDKSYSFDY